jgi:hypothetical protein
MINDEWSTLINKVTAIDNSICSHVHSSPTYGMTDTQQVMNELDFVVGWTKNRVKVLKNRRDGSREISTEELIPILSKLLVQNFLNEKMKLFEEELTREIETKIRQTFEKVKE